VRAFQRAGFLRRTAPLGVAALIALVLLLVFGPKRDLVLLAKMASAFVVVWGLAFVAPWDRLPRALDVAPPLILLVLLSILRLRVEPGFPVMAFAPLFLVPMFWVALYGDRRDVVVLTVALVLARLGPSVVRGDVSDAAQGAASVLVSSATCLLTNRVVVRARDAQLALQALIDRLPLGFAILRGERITYANERLARTLGWPAPRELLGVDVTSLVQEDQRAGLRERLDEARRGEESPGVDRRFVHRDGGEVILEAHAVRLHVDDEPVVGVMARDVTDERHLTAAEELARERIAREHEQLVAILAAIRDGVAILDGERRGVFANAAYLELFRLTERAFVGITRDAFVRHAATLSDDPAGFSERLAPVTVAPGHEEGTFTFAHPRRRIMQRTLRPITLPDGPGFLVVWHDVTAERDLIGEREHQAMTDPLTGLANRRGADEALVREVARAQRAGTSLTVAMLDIDHFKQVNDRLGHAAGDRVLVTIAGLLTAEARVTDTIARWGGEEFLAILPGDVAGARTYCERVRAALGGLEIAGVGPITLSAGVAGVDADDDVKGALERADRRLYEAKQAGRDRVVG